MAKKDNDFVRYTIYSRKDTASQEYNIPSYNKDVRNIVENAVKSALPKDAFFYVSDKQLSKQGRGRWDIYVHKEDKNVLGKSLSTIEKELTHSKSFGSTEKELTDDKSGNPRYHITRARPVDENVAKVLKKEERAREQEGDTETTRFNKSTLLKIVSVLTAIATIVRRILSSVLSFATQATKDMVTAHSLGMSYESVRSYRHTETAHGMKEGTITGAVADIQGKFGNITSLDEKALEALAVVMGGKIEEMAKMGLGASNPEKILGAILDDFNAKANAGYNSVGQYVGEAQARRELYSYLLKVSPQVADIFATMQEEQHNINSIYRNQADTFEKWKNAFPTSRGGHNEIEYNVTATLGQEWNALKTALDEIKEAVAVSLAPAVLGLIRWLMNRRVGLSASENAMLNEKNRADNKNYLQTIKQSISDLDEKEKTTPLTAGEKGYRVALQREAKKIEKELNKSKDKNVDNLVRTLDEVRSDAIMDTYAIITLGGQLNKDENGNYVDAIRQAVNDNLDPSVVEQEKQKLEANVRKKLIDQKLNEKKKLFDKLMYQYLKKDRMTYGDAYGKIIDEHPELVQMTTMTKKGLFGKEYKQDYFVWKYKELTEEELAEIENQVANEVTEKNLLLHLVSNPKYGGKLQIGSYLMEQARAETLNTPESALTALYQAVPNNPDAWKERLAKNMSKWLSQYSGSGANIIGVNTKEGNENVFKLVLDLNNNGVDVGDYTLGEFLGMKGFEGVVGQLESTKIDNKTQLSISTGTSASKTVNNTANKGD